VIEGGRLAFVVVLGGCGGGLPLLHPAQTLDAGHVRAGVGFSANVASGAFADALSAAGAVVATTPGAGVSDPSFAKGALVAASIAPGIAPWAGARVGVWDHVEGGLAYTGRAVRADGRRSVDLSRHWSLSIGAGGSAVLHGQTASDSVAHLDLAALSGWGLDAPVLVGYASDGGLYMVWLGGRGGWEHAELPDSSTLSATRFWGGGIFGLAAGFRHVHVAMEISASYASVSGHYGGTETHVAGVTLTPASGLWWDF